MRAAKIRMFYLAEANKTKRRSGQARSPAKWAWHGTALRKKLVTICSGLFIWTNYESRGGGVVFSAFLLKCTGHCSQCINVSAKSFEEEDCESDRKKIDRLEGTSRNSDKFTVIIKID